MRAKSPAKELASLRGELDKVKGEVRALHEKLEAKKRSLLQSVNYATKDLRKKGLEAVIYNQLSQVSSRKHQAIFLGKDGEWVQAKTKRDIARKIVSFIAASDR